MVLRKQLRNNAMAFVLISFQFLPGSSSTQFHTLIFGAIWLEWCHSALCAGPWKADHVANIVQSNNQGGVKNQLGGEHRMQ